MFQIASPDYGVNPSEIHSTQSYVVHIRSGSKVQVPPLDVVV